MIWIFDIKAIIKLIAKEILNINLLYMIVYINSKLLYNCLVKVDNIQEKWLIVNIMCLQQLYEGHKIMKIR